MSYTESGISTKFSTSGDSAGEYIGDSFGEGVGRGILAASTTCCEIDDPSSGMASIEGRESNAPTGE